MTFLEISEFTRDLKRLKKRYPSINEDLMCKYPLNGDSLKVEKFL